ncbi:hypothetical protein BKA63DRAFT_562469 [Paraphoma chrysanthemicola]|nr:hypothetical protein BKA63DRAFT_562469 [Paraphoma chrysanthemicola]
MAVFTFNKKRMSQTDLGKLFWEDFEISEALPNEALANITISALTLATASPYGLCLHLILPVPVLGLLALQHNGVTAIDGGFVQLLMMTTGRTELEKTAVRGCLGGEDDNSKRMIKMKVGFGEMSTEDAADGRNACRQVTAGTTAT